MPRKAKAPVASEALECVTNYVRGTTLHLGDGRRLAYGEDAIVPVGLAIMLRKRGQAI